ncbi:MAG: hypothetical protein ACLQFF_09090 [Steroidobacteraceae bacterium]|jgi:hypothetical protein
MPVMAAASTQRAAPARWTAARLMEYSERHLTLTARSEVSPEAQLASRLLENVPLYRIWEHTHGRLMQAVARAPQQAAAVELRKVTFLTLHRKAPFEYLRDRHIRGRARRQLIQALFGAQQHYGRCLVREHEAYVSSACSLMCADSLCSVVLGDEVFCEALEKYESAYGEYYRAYCDSLLAEQAGETAPMSALLPYLRYQLKIIRDHMLAGAQQQTIYKDLQALYAATGDTQKLPVLRPLQ